MEGARCGVGFDGSVEIRGYKAVFAASTRDAGPAGDVRRNYHRGGKTEWASGDLLRDGIFVFRRIDGSGGRRESDACGRTRDRTQIAAGDRVVLRRSAHAGGSGELDATGEGVGGAGAAG